MVTYDVDSDDDRFADYLVEDITPYVKDNVFDEWNFVSQDDVLKIWDTSILNTTLHTVVEFNRPVNGYRKWCSRCNEGWG